MSHLKKIYWLLIFTTSLLSASPIQHVIIISIDGGRPDLLLWSHTPHLREIISSGAYTLWAQTVKPSLTLISHSSMLGGVFPEKHGILWNDYQPQKGFIRTTTCFEIVKQSGRKTGMIVGKIKLKHIAKPGTVDVFQVIEGGAIPIANASVKVLHEVKPSLLFIHFPDPDTAGHQTGWGSNSYVTAIENCDTGIGILLNSLKSSEFKDKSLLIITADHGGHQNIHGTTDPKDMTIPWIAYSPGHLIEGQIEFPVTTFDTASTTVTALGLSPDPSWDGKSVPVFREN